MGDNFKIILEAMIDNSSLSNAQKQVAKERLKINADISVEDFAKSKKEIEKQIEALGKNIKSILGNAIDDKQANQWAKQYYDQMIAGAKEATREQEKYVDAMAKGREKAEAMRQAEEKRQQLAQNKVINKNLEEEYKLRVKNENAAKKQVEIDRQRALDFTKSSSERLSSAISKYSYGDTSEAKTLMQQMNRGLSNFGDLSNVEGNIQSLSSVIDKVITDLQESHKIGLQSINEEISAERELQTQRDNFNKKNLNAIDFEIQKREESARSFSSMLQAQMQEEQKFAAKADEIQLLSDSGQFQAQYDTLIAKTNQWTNEQGEARIATTALKQSLDELNQASDVYANNSSVENAQKLSTALEKYDAEAKKVNNSVRTMNATMAKDSAIQKLNQQIIEFMDKNPKAVKAFGKDLKNMLLQTQVGAEKTNQELDELTASFTTLKNTARSTGKLGNTFFGTIKENIKSFVPWTTGTGLIMGIANAAKGAISNVYKLDDAITDLVMATNASERQLESYIDTYIKLGDELSATVTDVTISATEWLKQGKSIAETETLIKDAMVLSKVGKMTSADATKYLTSAMKGYGVAVEDTLSIVDKMSAVDMDSATDVGGLAEGMSEVANNANLAGISMDKLLGYLATIGEVTQSSMSEVGTSLNAIFSRMGNIKLARLKDYQNNGEDLSNVETVLRGEGIALRDSASEFRNFGEVLDEVAGRWDSFSEVSQRAIASAFAGTNHMEDFLVLMQNYDTAMGYTETSMESSGQAMQKYEAYQESLAGKAERLNNALIALSDAFVESEFLGDLTEGATSAVKAITWLVDEIGVLTPLLSGAGTYFLGKKNLDWLISYDTNGAYQVQISPTAMAN